MQHPELADTFEAVAKQGKEGFYTGRIAQGELVMLLLLAHTDAAAIVDLVKSGGGVMTLEDLAECDAEVIEPIKYDFKVGAAGDEGVTLWEVSGLITNNPGILLISVSSQRTRLDGAHRAGYCRGLRDPTQCRPRRGGAQLDRVSPRSHRGFASSVRRQ